MNHGHKVHEPCMTCMRCGECREDLNEEDICSDCWNSLWEPVHGIPDCGCAQNTAMQCPACGGTSCDDHVEIHVCERP